MTKENALANVQASLGSLFTKDDVINIINTIEQPAAVAPPEVMEYQFMFQHLMECITEMALHFDWDDKASIAFHDLEFSINRNNVVELEDYTIDASELKDNFLHNLKGLFNEAEEEHKFRMEIINENK